MRSRLRMRLGNEGIDEGHSPALNVTPETTDGQTDDIRSRESRRQVVGSVLKPAPLRSGEKERGSLVRLRN
jgi:hypothetical protein